MQSPPNDKSEVVISLLSSLRTYNPSKGYFEQYLTNENFEYDIKVTNGRIHVSSSLVDDWTPNTFFIAEFESKRMASGLHSVIENVVPVRCLQNSSDFSSGHTRKAVKNNLYEVLFICSFICLVLPFLCPAKSFVYQQGYQLHSLYPKEYLPLMIKFVSKLFYNPNSNINGD